jgi:hypothetical protein
LDNLLQITASARRPRRRPGELNSFFFLDWGIPEPRQQLENRLNSAKIKLGLHPTTGADACQLFLI